MTGAACQAAVEGALAMGYRHIDTGQMYRHRPDVR
jgi:diketogulonate reductase-like aldo/keto reductase